MPAMDHSQALSDYLALGPTRSQRKLYRSYLERYPTGAPALETLKSWSVKYGWRAKATEFDRSAEHRLVERTQTFLVSRNMNRVEALSLVADQCLEDAASIRVSGPGASAQDKRALISAAIEATKLVEVLTGGVSDRQEKIAGMAQRAQDALKELEARARRRELQPPAPMIDVTPTHAEKVAEPEPREPREPSPRKPA